MPLSGHLMPMSGHASLIAGSISSERNVGPRAGHVVVSRSDEGERHASG